MKAAVIERHGGPEVIELMHRKMERGDHFGKIVLAVA